MKYLITGGAGFIGSHLAEAVKNGEKTVEVWGTGQASREFFYVDDAARGIVMATERYDGPEPVNLGAGMEITIRELVEKLKKISGFEGEIVWDTERPDGQPRRCLDVSRAKNLFKFSALIDFHSGLRKTYTWYLQNKLD